MGFSIHEQRPELKKFDRPSERGLWEGYGRVWRRRIIKRKLGGVSFKFLRDAFFFTGRCRTGNFFGFALVPGGNFWRAALKDLGKFSVDHILDKIFSAPGWKIFTGLLGESKIVSEPIENDPGLTVPIFSGVARSDGWPPDITRPCGHQPKYLQGIF